MKKEYNELILCEEVGFLPSGVYSVSNDKPEHTKSLFYRMNRRANLDIFDALDNVQTIAYAPPDNHASVAQGIGVYTLKEIKDQTENVYGPSFLMVNQGIAEYRQINCKGYFDYSCLEKLPPGQYQIDIRPYKNKIVNAPVDVSCDQSLIAQFQELKKDFTPTYSPLVFPEDLKQHESVNIMAYGIDRKLVILKMTYLSSQVM